MIPLVIFAIYKGLYIVHCMSEIKVVAMWTDSKVFYNQTYTIPMLHYKFKRERKSY